MTRREASVSYKSQLRVLLRKTEEQGLVRECECGCGGEGEGGGGGGGGFEKASRVLLSHFLAPPWKDPGFA